ncbi:MAG TPA: glycosyl transferase, partial [Clostridia bacterium]|nr:glycosyl transferase [Clostridia bacterium]
EWEQDLSNDAPDSEIFSDDHLWLLISIPAYIKETGDMEFLDAVIPYCDKGEDTVYVHMKMALEFSWSKRGSHGLLLGMRADWNDCINLRGKGESIWSTFLYYKCLEEMVDLSVRLNKTEDAEHFSKYKEEIKKNIDEYAWDGKWFLRGYLDNGKKLGGQESDQSKIFINSQTWSVVSGAVSQEKGLLAMDSLKEFLATEHGIVKNYPAYRKYDPEIGAITSFPPSLKENAGIFCHSNTWAVIAEALLGRGDRAYEFYRSYLPAAKNDNADLYTMEPYVYCQFITGKEHPYHFGRARNSWLTGTSSWSFVAVSQYILGVRAEYDGLKVDPCIPSTWDKFEVTRYYRGATYVVNVSNPDRVSKGIKELMIDGNKVEGNILPICKDGKEHIVNVVMG